VANPTFVGREPELAALERALETAAGGEAAFCILVGETGIGKSRLLNVVEGRAERRGFTVSHGDCLQVAGGELPFAALTGALRTLLDVDAVRFDDLPVAPEVWGEVARLLPELGTPSLDEEDPLGAEFGKSRLFEAVLAILGAAAAHAPVLIAIEDLQWTDRSTLDFLSFLIRNSRHRRLAVLMTLRSAEVPRGHPVNSFVLDLKRRGGRRLDLRPFDRDELRSYVEALRDDPIAPGDFEALLERSEGNPFFAAELLAASAEGRTGLPASLRDALMAQVDRLPGPCRSLVRAAATIGGQVDHRLLAAVDAVRVDELEPALREALAAQVLIEVVGAPSYSFRHPSLREAVYEDMLEIERRALHRRAAEALSADERIGSRDAIRAVELAHHWHAAGEPGPALRSSLEAGVASAAGGAAAEAALQFRRALELWESGSGDDLDLPLDRLELTRRAAEAFHLAGQSAAAVEQAEAALAITAAAPADQMTRALLHECLGRYLWTGGHGEAAMSAYRQAVELMPTDPPSQELALVLAAQGQALMLDNRPVESTGVCKEAIAVAEALAAPGVEARALNTLAINHCSAGEFEAAIAAARRARELATESGLIEEIGRSYVSGSESLDQAGRVGDAIAVAEEGVEFWLKLGSERGQADFLRAQIAGRLLRMSRWREAEFLLRELAGRRPEGLTGGQTEFQLAQLMADRGELEGAAVHLRRGGELLGHSGAVMWLALLQVATATVELWSGRPAEALAGVERFLLSIEGERHPLDTATLVSVGVRAAADLVEQAPGNISLRREADDGAQALWAGLERDFEDLPGAAPPLAAAARAEAAAELTRLSRRDSGAAWATAAERWHRYGDRYRAAYAEWREAGAILGDRGSRADATGRLERADKIAAELGAAPLRAGIAALAARARLKFPPAPRAPGAEAREEPRPDAKRLDLTPREVEVLGRLALGASNRQIADDLFITEKTAGHHVSHILAKLGARNRGGAVAIARGRGFEIGSYPDAQQGRHA
jgi:DNA-binding CsgD family transcriptional regulator/tetratricopeptide (TPR) repeat protein